MKLTLPTLIAIGCISALSRAPITTAAAAAADNNNIINFEDESAAFKEALVAKINSKATWRATAKSPVAQLRREDFAKLGMRRELIEAELRAQHNRVPRKVFTAAERAAAPASFDARDAWPSCASIRQIRDQSWCSCCWAFAAVESMSDRTCIKHGYDVFLSAEDMLACSGGGTCRGGVPTAAYEYWVHSGVVTEACRNYSYPSCDRYYIKNITNPCPEKKYPTPKCVRECRDAPGLPEAWNRTKHYGEKTYTVSGEEDIMAEVAANGPCEATITMFEDFQYYESGVYAHTHGAPSYLHCVKIIGYGTDPDGTKYWLCANSWNEKWGENGFFRIRRGVNECGIETYVQCGVPK